MEHYTPTHPLPEEIQAMKRDDTVCQFCGVSYLIHTEIKALEDKLAKVEAELARFQGSEERERQLQAALDLSRNETALLQAQLKDRDSVIAMLQGDSDKRVAEVTRLSDKNQQLENTLVLEKENVVSARKDNSHLRQVVTELLTSLKQQKEVITMTKKDVQEQISGYEKEIQRVSKVTVQAVDQMSQRESQNEVKIRQLTQVTDDHEVTIEELSAQLRQANAQLSDVDQLSSQIHQASHARDEAERVSADAKETIKTLESKCWKLTGDWENSQNNYQRVSLELEAVTHQFKISQQTYDGRLTALDRELSHTENELERVTTAYEQLVHECQLARQQQLDREKAAARSKDETEDMRTKLERVLGDLEALKYEREQMITAHHNRIEDLRDSFKRKMAEAEKWPEKMDTTLQRERAKHQAESSALETALKENFIMEMEIEKQKHQKLVERNKVDLKAEIVKLKGELQTQSSNQSELQSLKRQLRTAKADAQGSEARLRSEIDNLKSIINNLEGRLGKLDTGDQELMLQLKSALSDKERSLEDYGDRVRAQEEEIAQLKEQLRVLQDTVSRECEERMELIDALGEAREQLLHLKKPAGGYSSRNSSPMLPANLPPRATPTEHSSSIVPSSPATKTAPDTTVRTIKPSSPTSSRRSGNTAELLLFKRSGQSAHRKPSNSSSSAGSGSSAGSNDKAAITNGNASTLKFQPDSSKAKPMQALRALDSTQKKRLAAILSRTKP